MVQRMQPLVPSLDDDIAKLKQELLATRQKAEELSEVLENPENQTRWRKLDGKIPDKEELQAKVVQLEERLNDKREQLLEKDLILEEVTNLSERLKQQAAEGKRNRPSALSGVWHQSLGHRGRADTHRGLGPLVAHRAYQCPPQRHAHTLRRPDARSVSTYVWIDRRARCRSAAGRSETLSMAQRANDLQGRIRAITRRIMATVSELSMYQASTIKLDAEKQVGGVTRPTGVPDCRRSHDPFPSALASIARGAVVAHASDPCCCCSCLWPLLLSRRRSRRCWPWPGSAWRPGWPHRRRQSRSGRGWSGLPSCWTRSRRRGR